MGDLQVRNFTEMNKDEEKNNSTVFDYVQSPCKFDKILVIGNFIE